MHVTDRVTYLLKERGTLSLGAAKDQLVIEGVGTDVNNPLLRELAGRLRRHHLGAISFHQGVSKHEVLQFLTLMAEEPDLTDQLLGLVLCSQSLFRFADLGDDGLCRGGPDKGCGVIVSAIDVVVDRLD